MYKVHNAVEAKVPNSTKNHQQNANQADPQNANQADPQNANQAKRLGGKNNVKQGNPKFQKTGWMLLKKLLILFPFGLSSVRQFVNN